MAQSGFTLVDDMDDADIVLCEPETVTEFEARTLERSTKGPAVLVIACPLAGAGELDRAPDRRVMSRPYRGEALLESMRELLNPTGGTANSSSETNASEQPLADLLVLVVDDVQVNRVVASKMLLKLGARVLQARDGAEAVQVVQQDAPDVVLMDCQMPVMDGFEASRKIRAIEGDAANVPIVALTANAMSGDEEACREAGMNAYMTKPVRMAELRERLENLDQLSWQN